MVGNAVDTEVYTTDNELERSRIRNINLHTSSSADMNIETHNATKTIRKRNPLVSGACWSSEASTTAIRVSHRFADSVSE